jgi:hypothetical protein
MTIVPPVFVAEYESSWSTTTTPKTVTPTIEPGDCLVIAGLCENISPDDPFLNTPTDDLGSPLTYTSRQTVSIPFGVYGYARIWTAIVGAQSGSFTLSMTQGGGTKRWGFNCLRFRDVSAIGASNKANADVSSGGSTVSLTTQQANSAVVSFAINNQVDISPPARTWRTVNSITPTSGNGLEKTYVNVSGFGAVYGAYWNNAGAAGANNYGLSSPGDQIYSIVALELKGIDVPPGFGSGFFDGV